MLCRGQRRLLPEGSRHALSSAYNTAVLGIKKAHSAHMCQAQEPGPQSTGFCHGQWELERQNRVRVGCPDGHPRVSLLGSWNYQGSEQWEDTVYYEHGWKRNLGSLRNQVGSICNIKMTLKENWRDLVSHCKNGDEKRPKNTKSVEKGVWQRKGRWEVELREQMLGQVYLWAESTHDTLIVFSCWLVQRGWWGKYLFFWSL